MRRNLDFHLQQIRFGIIRFGSVRIPKLRYSVFRYFTRFGRSLCSGAGYMVVQVFQQFFSESSAFKQYEESISEFPTIVICTPESLNSDFPGVHYDYDINFEIG